MTEPTPDPRVRLCALREEQLSVEEVLAALDDDASGGVTLFVGRVRDHDGGKGVTGLEYSAHPSALDRLADVCERVAASYDVVEGTTVPPALRSTKEIEVCWTASLKVAVGVVETGTPLAPAAGVRPVTVGFVVSAVAVVKDQVSASIVLPAWSFAPLTRTV